APGLVLQGGHIEAAAPIGVLGGLKITTAEFEAMSSSTIALPFGSALVFAGPSNPLYTVHGTIEMGGASIITDAKLRLDGGTLFPRASFPAADVIAGDLAVLNNGTINIGLPPEIDPTLGPGGLVMATGSLTVGALTPELPATGGTVNIYGGRLLTFPAAAAA